MGSDGRPHDRRTQPGGVVAAGVGGGSMTATTDPREYDLDGEIGRWRSFALRRDGVTETDVDELEDHLRQQVDDLVTGGLRVDEAFLIGVKRMGDLDELSREFAREHSDRLWKQLVLGNETGDGDAARWEPMVVVGLAVAAAVAVRVPELFGLSLSDGDDAAFYGRNLSLLVLPFLAAYFGWKRGLGRREARPAAAATVGAFAVGALFANVYPFGGAGHTEVLTSLHLPIALWFVVGFTYVGGEWRSPARRMDFIRFSGEWFVYYVLLALGGGLLVAFTVGAFAAIDIDIEDVIENWLLPCGAAGAVIVAGWLVEAKQGVIENIAPVLTRVFTPLFSLLLAAFLVAMVATRSWLDVDRDLLIFFDLLLVVVLGLLLYSLSARTLDARPVLADWLSLSLVVGALVIDVLVLVAILGRIGEFGFSANKTAALGENLVLLANLGWAAWLYRGFLGGRRSFEGLLRWQTAYLPIIAVWAALVVIVFPPVFGFD